MNKFKVGDKANVIRTGKIGIIRKIYGEDFSEDGRSNQCYLIDNGYYTVHDIELVQEILTDKEKEYLNGVIRPFKDGITSICKQEWITGTEEYIEIKFSCGDPIILPEFVKETYYKNMESGKDYTLKELWL